MSAKIRPGKTDRETVHDELGKPVYSSRYWRFDLFREEASQSKTVFAITPWPVPFAHLSDGLLRYTLVTYDTGKCVSQLKSDVFRKVPNWRSESPIQNDYCSLQMTCDGVTVLLDRRVGGENLCVAGVGRDAYLRHQATSPDSTLVIGAGPRGLGLRLSVDGGKAMSLPTRIPEYPGLETLVAVKLPAGIHVLEFSSKYLDKKASRKLSCEAGDVLYLQLDVTGTAEDKTIAWKFDQWQVMPAAFAKRPLVLVHDGEWLVKAEP